MGVILDYIEQNNQVNVHCYKTRKLTLDDANYESITSENSDTDTIPMDTSGKIAEDDARRIHTVRISRHLIETTQPWFTFFLDGSRHTYKVDDISIFFLCQQPVFFKIFNLIFDKHRRYAEVVRNLTDGFRLVIAWDQNGNPVHVTPSFQVAGKK